MSFQLSFVHLRSAIPTFLTTAWLSTCFNHQLDYQLVLAKDLAHFLIDSTALESNLYRSCTFILVGLLSFCCLLGYSLLLTALGLTIYKSTPLCATPNAIKLRIFRKITAIINLF